MTDPPPEGIRPPPQIGEAPTPQPSHQFDYDYGYGTEFLGRGLQGSEAELPQLFTADMVAALVQHTIEGKDHEEIRTGLVANRNGTSPKIVNCMRKYQAEVIRNLHAFEELVFYYGMEEMFMDAFYDGHMTLLQIWTWYEVEAA